MKRLWFHSIEETGGSKMSELQEVCHYPGDFICRLLASLNCNHEPLIWAFNGPLMGLYQDQTPGRTQPKVAERQAVGFPGRIQKMTAFPAYHACVTCFQLPILYSVHVM